ncbi:MAG TPA: threonine--tRNA ligase [bacterium]|jgi:threonyl-tRNA synthetase|nr:threonine--tRNA ligase [bacterium]
MKKQKVVDKIKDDPLFSLRHSAEHVMQLAVESLFPGAKKVMGPPIEDGFYGDFDYDGKITEEDFPKIEQKMRDIVKENLPIKMRVATFEEIKETFKDNPFKLEMINDLEKDGEKPTVCEIGAKDGKFYDIDLCAGNHVGRTGNIGFFKLLSVAGAYWRGSEKNKMLTRIYATAFETQEELDEYLAKMEEQKKRDHRNINKDLEVFTLFEEVGPGLPLWLPNGMIIREELENWGKETEEKWGYQRVSTPFVTKKKLFELSGHVSYFGEEMFKVEVPGEEEDEYFIKPMNCPFHHLIFKSKTRTYKDLPLKLAEYGTVARYENRGSINGILRPRVFCQNDAHIYCSEEQAVDVFLEIVDLHRYYYSTLGLTDYHVELNLRDPEKMNKYHGEEEMWQKAEKITREALDKSGIEYTVVNEGAAHYGPKMDFKIKSAIGTEYGISTNQIDLYMPEKFGLKYVDKDGKEKPVIVQHRAPLGSSERFIGFLMEHFAGAFPVWLSPVQVQIIPIGEKHLKYAREVSQKFKDKKIRTFVDDRSETMQAKIRDSQIKKIPYMLIVGDKEVENNKVSVRLRTEENLGARTIDEVISKVEEMYLTKSLNLW